MAWASAVHGPARARCVLAAPSFVLLGPGVAVFEVVAAVLVAVAVAVVVMALAAPPPVLREAARRPAVVPRSAAVGRAHPPLPLLRRWSRFPTHFRRRCPCSCPPPPILPPSRPAPPPRCLPLRRSPVAALVLAGFVPTVLGCRSPVAASASARTSGAPTPGRPAPPSAPFANRTAARVPPGPPGLAGVPPPARAGRPRFVRTRSAQQVDVLRAN